MKLVGIFAFVASLLFVVLHLLTKQSQEVRTIRAQVAEGLEVSGGVRAAVTEFFLENREWPTDNDAVDLAPADEIVGNYVSGVSVEDGVVVVTYGNSAQDSIQGHSIWFEPDESNPPAVSWSCYRSDIADEFLPSTCRSN